jgi:hypothetical protein
MYTKMHSIYIIFIIFVLLKNLVLLSLEFSIATKQLIKRSFFVKIQYILFFLMILSISFYNNNNNKFIILFLFFSKIPNIGRTGNSFV